MYKFYYETLQLHFREKNLELLYLDTDSFILKIRTHSLAEDLLALKPHFDFSNYPKDHPLYSSTNARFLAYLKMSWVEKKC